MLTANLTDALLDYWTARAEGVPADQLEIRRAVRPGDPRSPDYFCVHTARRISNWMTRPQRPLDYSTNWALSGPLLEKWADHPMMQGTNWNVIVCCDTPLIAICRAVVRAAFGDEVEDLPC